MARVAHNAIAMKADDWEDSRWRQVKEQVQRYGRQLTGQEIDEKQEDNGDRRWLVD